VKCRVSLPGIPMPKRTAQFVSAIFASFLAGAALTTASNGVARAGDAPAADDCLASPKGQTPHGGHWYYHIDHSTKRHCWYLGEEHDKLSQTTPSNSSPSENPVAPKAEATIQPSIADAHAELPPQPQVEQPKHDDAPAPAMPADAAASENNAVASTGNTQDQRSMFASRWPDPSSAYLSASTMANTSTMANKIDPDTSGNKVDTDTSASAPPANPPSQAAPPIVATEQFAAADLSSQTPPTYSVQMQLAALVGALALAGVIGSVIFKLVSTRRHARIEIEGRRVAIWETEEHGALPAFAGDHNFAGDRDDRAAKFFPQRSRRAPS
jgi:hypothetical protein